MKIIYGYLDGDNVGHRLELLLLDSLVDDARAYSRAVEEAMAQVGKALQAKPDVDIVLTGGDDLLVRWPRGSLINQDFVNACEVFKRVCGQTASVGIGDSSRSAAQSLRRAKLMGKATIFAGCEDWE